MITLISLNSCATNNITSPIIGTWEADFDGCIETWIIDNKGNVIFPLLGTFKSIVFI